MPEEGTEMAVVIHEEVSLLERLRQDARNGVLHDPVLECVLEQLEEDEKFKKEN